MNEISDMTLLFARIGSIGGLVLREQLAEVVVERLERFRQHGQRASLLIEPIALPRRWRSKVRRMDLKSSWVQPNACWRSSSGTAVWVAGDAILGAGSDSSLT